MAGNVLAIAIHRQRTFSIPQNQTVASCIATANKLMTLHGHSAVLFLFGCMVAKPLEKAWPKEWMPSCCPSTVTTADFQGDKRGFPDEMQPSPVCNNLLSLTHDNRCRHNLATRFGHSEDAHPPHGLHVVKRGDVILLPISSGN